MKDQLLADLRQDEGWEPFVYRDTRNLQTIGLPKPVAEFWLRYALDQRLDAFRKLWPDFDQQPEDVQRALGNMAFQIGPYGLFEFTKMLAALKAGDRAGAALEAANSKWYGQTPNRARRVVSLIRGLGNGPARSS